MDNSQDTSKGAIPKLTSRDKDKLTAYFAKLMKNDDNSRSCGKEQQNHLSDSLMFSTLFGDKFIPPPQSSYESTSKDASPNINVSTEQASTSSEETSEDSSSDDSSVSSDFVEPDIDLPPYLLNYYKDAFPGINFGRDQAGTFSKNISAKESSHGSSMNWFGSNFNSTLGSSRKDSTSKDVSPNINVEREYAGAFAENTYKKESSTGSAMNWFGCHYDPKIHKARYDSTTDETSANINVEKEQTSKKPQKKPTIGSSKSSCKFGETSYIKNARAKVRRAKTAVKKDSSQNKAIFSGPTADEIDSFRHCTYKCGNEILRHIREKDTKAPAKTCQKSRRQRRADEVGKANILTEMLKNPVEGTSTSSSNEERKYPFWFNKPYPEQIVDHLKRLANDPSILVIKMFHSAVMAVVKEEAEILMIHIYMLMSQHKPDKQKEGITKLLKSRNCIFQFLELLKQRTPGARPRYLLKCKGTCSFINQKPQRRHSDCYDFDEVLPSTWEEEDNVSTLDIDTTIERFRNRVFFPNLGIVFIINLVHIITPSKLKEKFGRFEGMVYSCLRAIETNKGIIMVAAVVYNKEVSAKKAKKAFAADFDGEDEHFLVVDSHCSNEHQREAFRLLGAMAFHRDIIVPYNSLSKNMFDKYIKLCQVMF